jgi:hypothetical protein
MTVLPGKLNRAKAVLESRIAEDEAGGRRPFERKPKL